MATDETLFPVERALGVVDAQQRVVLQVALLATIYFERGHTLETRRAVAACFKEYRDMVNGHLHWAHPGKKGFDRINGPSTTDPTVWLTDPEMDEQQGWEFTWHGGVTDDSASHFMIRGLAARSWQSERQGALSFLSFALPITWFAERKDGFPRMLYRFCERIRPIHGYGGFGLVQSPNRFIVPTHEETVYALAKRHPGLEIDDPVVHVIYLTDAIKGANWLTALDDRWISRLGGLQALSDRLKPPASVHTYPGGCIIMAGPHPQLGDVNRTLLPTSYGPLSRLLAPIRIRGHGRLHSIGPFDQDEFAAWLARLDMM